MRKAQDIYKETKLECHNDNCQSLDVMAILSIEKAQKEMFYFLYDKASENQSLSVMDFFNKMDRELNFP